MGCFKMVTLPGIICNVRRQNGFQVWEVGVRNRGDPEWANCNSIKQTVAEVDAARALTRRRDVIGSGWIMHRFLAGIQDEYIKYTATVG